MVRLAVIIIVLATMIGVLMPSPPKAVAAADNAAPAAEPWFADDGSTITVAAASSSPSRTSSNDSSQASGGEVRLTRHRNGHFYADVQVNGTTVEFMVDTGATSIAMTPEDARRAGLNLAAADTEYVGEGAGGALSGRRITLDQVRLGGKIASDMDAVVIDGASTNLLGQSFLSRFSEVTVRGDVMTLR